MSTTPWTALENLFLNLVNETRAQAGVAPLSQDAELLDAARDHDQFMDENDVFSHTGINGSDPGTRITDAGYGFLSWGENIAWATGGLNESTVHTLHDLLVNSPGHYANMINPNFAEVGIGLQVGTFQGQEVVFVTEDFGSPTAEEAAEPDLYLGFDVLTDVTTPLYWV
jgi:serralysin